MESDRELEKEKMDERAKVRKKIMLKTESKFYKVAYLSSLFTILISLFKLSRSYFHPKVSV